MPFWVLDWGIPDYAIVLEIEIMQVQAKMGESYVDLKIYDLEVARCEAPCYLCKHKICDFLNSTLAI
jgi:hypothetical protein